MSVVLGSLRQRVRASIEEPVGRFFGRLGFTPNALTLIGFAIALAGAYLAAGQAWAWAGVVVAFGAVFDLFDGALARATDRISNFGAFMDSTFDRLGEAAVYIGIAIGLGTVQGGVRLSPVTIDASAGPILAMIAMASAFAVSYVRAKSDSLGFSAGSGMANVGLAPREVRTLLLVVGLLAAGTFGLSTSVAVPAGVTPPPPMWWLVIVAALGLIAVLATVTTIQRILFVHQQSKSEPTQGKENQ